jgi:hypothetical protein
MLDPSRAKATTAADQAHSIFAHPPFGCLTGLSCIHLFEFSILREEEKLKEPL